jgi:calcineurin-like phosphoesterase family protein
MAFESQESSKKKILVIGNDRETQVSLKGCLIEQAQAYEIFEARDDKQALSFMQKKVKNWERFNSGSCLSV